MTATCYVTFGQKYRHEVHPIDRRAHPDGWFEYDAPTWEEASAAARRHLLVEGERGGWVALFAFDYSEQPDPGFYPRRRLARFNVVDGAVQEARR